MPTVADNAFARRMMERPRPESLNSDPAYRIFYDPPELIQIAFGGRQWFWEQGCTGVHRVGVFKGLGWELPLVVKRQEERGITGVRITARRAKLGGEQLYDLEFLARVVDPEYASGPITQRVIDHRPGLTVDQLKPAYAEVLGEHAI